jgi:Domain of unknown function (DUF4262)
MDLAKEKKSIALNIRKYGWHCLHVFPNSPGPNPLLANPLLANPLLVNPLLANQGLPQPVKSTQFTYTIGFTESYGVPEIMLFGFPHDRSHPILSTCAALIKEGYRFETDMPHDNILQGGYEVIFKSAKPQCFEEYFGTAMRYYGARPFEAIVMFIPDKHHRFPWKMSYAGAPAAEALSIVSM